MSGCPRDRAETAEAYAMRRLSAEESAAFEEHCLFCPACTEEVIAAEAFIRAIRAAGTKLERQV